MTGIKKKIILAASLVVATAGICWANVPPPPVNQYLGIPDSIFDNLNEEDCRVCHNADVPGNPGVPDRHHLLVGDPIPPNSVIPVPVPGDPNYGCINCHPEGGIGGFVIIRDCTECHKQSPGGYTVHHQTVQAQNRDCVYCHGSIVDNYNDGHYIPSYTPSLVTPWPSDKPNGGPDGEGACNFCHDAGIDTSQGYNITVVTNRTAHHSTGFGFDGTKCAWCHDPAVTDDRYLIRQCETCHGPLSLHNIQVDSPNPNNPGTIVVGQEDPWYGHIGTNDDCFGCHGFTALSAAPFTGPTAMTIVNVSPGSVIEGGAVEITIFAEGIVNETNGTTYTASAELTAADGTVIPLTTTAIDLANGGSLTASVPAGTAAGSYELRLVKAGSDSNVMNFSILSGVENNNIVCRGRSVTIKGSGYSEYLAGLSSDTSLVAIDRSGNEIACSIRSWEDDMITASCAACPSSVTVTNVFEQQDTSRVRTLRSRR